MDISSIAQIASTLRYTSNNDHCLNLKRKRSKNFTEDEKQFLLLLIKEFGVMDKETEVVNNKHKVDGWVKIAQVFNKYSYHMRNAKQLKIFHENAKAKMKRNEGKDKFIHVQLSLPEREILVRILAYFKNQDRTINFEDIQSRIWNQIHDIYNKITKVRRVPLLELYIFYKMHLSAQFVDIDSTNNAMQYVTVTIKSEPEDDDTTTNNISQNNNNIAIPQENPAYSTESTIESNFNYESNGSSDSLFVDTPIEEQGNNNPQILQYQTKIKLLKLELKSSLRRLESLKEKINLDEQLKQLKLEIWEMKKQLVEQENTINELKTHILNKNNNN